jgi:hypothetical protein
MYSLDIERSKPDFDQAIIDENIYMIFITMAGWIGFTMFQLLKILRVTYSIYARK